jgi:hypothetical protein
VHTIMLLPNDNNAVGLRKKKKKAGAGGSHL